MSTETYSFKTWMFWLTITLIGTLLVVSITTLVAQFSAFASVSSLNKEELERKQADDRCVQHMERLQEAVMSHIIEDREVTAKIETLMGKLDKQVDRIQDGCPAHR